LTGEYTLSALTSRLASILERISDTLLLYLCTNLLASSYSLIIYILSLLAGEAGGYLPLHSENSSEVRNFAYF
jgi:hypothetical protein